jgi:hypothetical protein
MRGLQVNLTPWAEHILDWFHITMRLTVLRQFAKWLPEGGERTGRTSDNGYPVNQAWRIGR